jgi:polyhydroxyalkanoate synthesis regulator phasin
VDHQPPTRLSSREFTEDLLSSLYLQVALVSNQISSLTKILFVKGILTTEEVEAIRQDMTRVIENLTKVSEASNDLERDSRTEDKAL